MAIVTYATGIEELRGKVDTSVFKRNRYNKCCQAVPSGIVSSSAVVLSARSRFAVVVRSWKLLSDAQRLEWIDYSTNLEYPTKRTPGEFLNGYNLFCLVNMTRLLLLQEITPIPIYGNLTLEFSLGLVQFDASQLSIEFNAPVNWDDFRAVIHMSPLLTTGSIHTIKRLHYMLSDEIGGTYLDQRGPWETYYNRSLVGRFYIAWKVYVVHYDSWLPSLSQSFCTYCDII